MASRRLPDLKFTTCRTSIQRSIATGNDDQGFWSIMSMDATEKVFPETKGQKDLGAGFLEITQTVHNLQVGRWDETTCGGGLRWQINNWNNNYKYKNTISNGLFFQQSARLAKYTGNVTYADWAEKTYKWLRDKKFIQDDFYINDGANVPNCDKFSNEQWTYNYGTIMAGCAAMYNFTDGSARAYWKEQIDNVLNATIKTFFDADTGAIKEIQCQEGYYCNDDQPSFKAYLARWMGYTAQVAPYTYNDIMPRLRKNAQLAAATCVGGSSGRDCGLKWNIGPQFDGKTGLGEQLSAMEVIQNAAPFVANVGQVLQANNGGESKSNPNATGKKIKKDKVEEYLPYMLKNYHITGADRFGAAILTILTVAGFGAGVAFSIMG
ncbi:hydrolase 76 protein, variant 3 [Orbilia ellipsospora]|uniref:mannan endo-1,6-alpha-mannosidase n=1 Tax=Orbilia ellipsospora TaxID=2528407 RepID=A0AAV9X7W6_9PEZI